MSKSRFDNECEGCRPAMIDPRTRQKIPDDAPAMIIVRKLWDQQTMATKEAWHRVTCLNSRDKSDLATVETFNRSIREALANVRNEG